MKPYLVTIILATYNRAHLITGMLDAIKNQTHTNWECIIIDDNSTDQTKEIIESNYISLDKRFSYVLKDKKRPKGIPASRNIGIEKAKGEYIIFFDDDDLVHPKLLETSLFQIQKNNLDFVHYIKKAFVEEFDKQGFNPIGDIESIKITNDQFSSVILGDIAMASCTVLWKASILKRNKFNEELLYAEEWELYSRMFIKEKLIGEKINVILYHNRKHENSNTGEFYAKNPLRVASKHNATKLVLKELTKHQKLTSKLYKFFVKEFYLGNKLLKKLLVKNMNSITAFIYFYTFPIRFFLYKKLKK